MRFLNFTQTGAVCYLLTVLPGITSQAENQRSILDRNLLVNAGAEQPVNGQNAVPGWGPAQEGFVAEPYGHTTTEWEWNLSGCAGCGKQYFRVFWEGSETSSRTISQTIDVTPAAADVDAGRVQARLAGYLGTIRNTDTTGHLQAVFLNATGQSLGDGPVETAPFDSKSLPKAREGDASIVRFQAEGAVPAGTRKIRVSFVVRPTGGSGAYYGFADQLSLHLFRPSGN